MAINIKYIEAFERAFTNLANAPRTPNPFIGHLLDEPIQMLKIGLIKLDFYRSYEDEKNGKKQVYELYRLEDKKIDMRRRIVMRQLTDGKTVAVYAAYQLAGAKKWDDNEKARVKYLLHQIYIYNSRNLLMNMVQRAENYDTDYNIHNLHWVMGMLKRLEIEQRLGEYIAIHFNLRRFTVINQQIGRQKGNVVLRRFIAIIESVLEDEEYFGRIGGDNFILVIKKKSGRKIIKMLEGTGVVYDDERGDRVLVSASMGVYVIPEDPGSLIPNEILDRIFAASHIAKTSIDTDIVYFDELFLKQREKSLNISSMIPDAFKNEEFKVFYQPKISLNGLELSGAEALCRWMHNGTMISPGDFIPIMEQGVEICRLDFYMLEHVCRDLRRWIDAGKRAVRISVNFSRRHLTDMDFLSHILEIIDKYEVPHQYIEVELTETTTDVQFRDLKRVVRGLQKEGISTAVDDFGVGYSSLNLIRDIPWNVLKIDRSFLPMAKETNSNAKEMIFRYVVAMAQGLNLECIVEGVETREQIELLKQNNCMLVQGFFFDRPLPVAEFEKKLDNYIYHMDEF